MRNLTLLGLLAAAALMVAGCSGGADTTVGQQPNAKGTTKDLTGDTSGAKTKVKAAIGTAPHIAPVGSNEHQPLPK